MNISSVDRIPPTALDSESVVLGASIIDRDAFEIASAIVNPADFYATFHESIYAAIVALYATGSGRIDKIGVAEELRRRGHLEKIGGLGYLTGLLDIVVTTQTVEHHARVVVEKATLRRLIHAGSKITALGYDGEDDVSAAMIAAEGAMSEVTAATASAVVESVYEVMERLEAQRNSPTKESTFYGPWAGLNQQLGGFMPGELIGWVSAPQMGKSGVVSMLADYTAEKYGAVVLAALENGVDRTVQRLLALRTGVSARKQRIGVLDRAERMQLEAASYLYATRPFYVVGRKEAGSIAALWRVCRTVARTAKVSTIIVDHASKLDDVTREQGKLSKHERLSNAYEKLIELGQHFGCPVHVVQHFNREGQTMGEPSLASLGKIRDGGNLEGHADAVIMPHRENPIGTPEEKSTGKFIIAKSRDGDACALDMRYIGHKNMWIEATEHGAWFEYDTGVSEGVDASDLFGDAS